MRVSLNQKKKIDDNRRIFSKNIEIDNDYTDCDKIEY